VLPFQPQRFKTQREQPNRSRTSHSGGNKARSRSSRSGASKRAPAPKFTPATEGALPSPDLFLI
jgi:hypothetical protein